MLASAGVLVREWSGSPSSTVVGLEPKLNALLRLLMLLMLLIRVFVLPPVDLLSISAMLHSRVGGDVCVKLGARHTRISMIASLNLKNVWQFNIQLIAKATVARKVIASIPLASSSLVFVALLIKLYAELPRKTMYTSSKQ